MKKVLFLLMMIGSVALYGQDTVSIGQLTTVSSLNNTDVIPIEQSDSTRKVALSGLDLRWQSLLVNEAGLYSALSDVSRFLEFEDSTEYATFFALTDTAADLRTAIAGLAGGHDAVTLAGTPDYITLVDQVITRNAIDLANDVTGELDTSNIDMSQLDAKYSLASDSIVTVYREGITATRSVTGDSVFVGWDSTAVYAEIATKKDIDDAELVFGLSFGVGNAGDTIIFQNGNIIYAVEWDGDYSLTITEVTVDAYHATLTPDIDIALLSAATFRDATPTEILTADITVTATEQNITTFSDAVIDPGEWFMIRIDEATTEPTQLNISIDGTKQ